MSDRRVPRKLLASWRNYGRNPYTRTFLPFTRRLEKTNEDKRPRPALWDISHGCILWLPMKDRVQMTKPPEDPFPIFDRPVVVLDLKIEDAENASIIFLYLWQHAATGRIKDTKLWTAKTNPNLSLEKIRRLDAAAPDFRKETTLYLENHRRPEPDEKPHSFVNIRNKYSIEWQNLRCYDPYQPDAFRYRLDQESFLKLAEKVPDFDFSPASWIPTHMLWPTFYERWIMSRFRFGSRPAQRGMITDDEHRWVMENSTKELQFPPVTFRSIFRCDDGIPTQGRK